MTRFISKLPVLGSIWDRVSKQPTVRRCVEELKLAIRYRRPFPSSVVLPHSGSPIFVDRNEPRGRSVLLCRAQGQPNLKQIWARSAEILRPDIVLDVGANYGEFIFAERYSQACRIVGVEANENLAGYLERSRQRHPDRDRITLVTALAADVSDREVEFFLDQKSSGRSTAVRRDDTPTIATKIRSVAIDDLFGDLPLEELTVLFKVDVEGFEPAVFAGMQQLLTRSGRLVGFLEFNPRLIGLSGNDPAHFLANLHRLLTITALPHAAPPYVLQTGTLAEIEQREGKAEFEMDLFVHKPNHDPAQIQAILGR